MMRPTITVIIYIPSCLATTSKSAMEMIFPQMRQAIPRGEYLRVNAGYVCNQDYFLYDIYIQCVCRYISSVLKACRGQHLPHNRTNKLHNDLIQDVEKLQHQFGLFSHFPHNNSKSHKESNQTCNTEKKKKSWINPCSRKSISQNEGQSPIENIQKCKFSDKRLQ